RFFRRLKGAFQLPESAERSASKIVRTIQGLFLYKSKELKCQRKLPGALRLAPEKQPNEKNQEIIW
ncbi:MAG: hypothetical protein IKS80_06730, partial [Bacteroidaceae bacterium]|nr:hypothetical protein [Bacteroidaceae bacterium]